MAGNGDSGSGANAGGPSEDQKQRRSSSIHPKKLIFAPGDIQVPAGSPEPVIQATETADPSATFSKTAISRLTEEIPRSYTSTPTSVMESHIVSHPARAHQFVSNPPLTISQLHPTNPLRQFNAWFHDPRLPPSSAPETCTLATASMPLGRVSARVLYLKELDERGWVVYSNWGSRQGKGKQVFGANGPGEGWTSPEEAYHNLGLDESGTGAAEEQDISAELGNKWAALTFLWPAVERQVRIEGLVEPLSREESELYWRTRERGSQIGGWASHQSKVLWSAEPGTLPPRRKSNAKLLAEDETNSPSADLKEDINKTDIDDGRGLLEQRVKEMEARFADTEEIPLPPFWGGVRIVPESVEFWQGRRSRLHDRFRYVRVAPRTDENGEDVFTWRIERLSP
ncbi:hypothetical protein DTO207G8_8027 [Paecilomyces variotii]|nr:hypothetical protein DTO169C6_4887 [Paecilomyces variotii]KAJ9247561.1 hypothetical protein DTO207G8_8027 [Paecilomyces variotii]KAJ9347767.1 hypothetical protein DTO027B9_8871 [Paecilomyces variotii]KAJ9392817.1 hypothetical protein DTO063F5_617 [Paecilomyces variotii]